MMVDEHKLSLPAKRWLWDHEAISFGLFDDRWPNFALAQQTSPIRVVFSIPTVALPTLFPTGKVPAKHLAYIEWFTSFSQGPVADHLMYKISRSPALGGGLLSSIKYPDSQYPLQCTPPAKIWSWTSSNLGLREGLGDVGDVEAMLKKDLRLQEELL
ncbi:hypothetical protein C8J56DRAFT_896343 [Mycena floridula]|nr:hypothetical protein C8J56DRAFT_896343 [Mycena floridula]